MQHPPEQPDVPRPAAADPPRPAIARLTFRRRDRLSGRLAFAAVFENRLREHRGPFTVFARTNGLAHSRLGLSVGRRVGSAVVRNRIKRRLREAFRLQRGRLPAGYDWVLAVRPHEPLRLDAYQHLLRDAAEALDRKHQQRQRRAARSTESQDR